MPYPVYLIREPVPTVSRALFSPDNHEWTVVAIEHALVDRSSSPIGEVLSPGRSGLAERQALTYRELLALLMNAGKVITL